MREEISATLHGVKLTLVAPKQVYAADEVTRMTVRVQNLTRESMVLDSSCDAVNPRVEVRTHSGFITYPPAVLFMTAPQCPPHQRAPTLLPGTTLQRQMYVIVRARYVRAVVRLAPPRILAPPSTPDPWYTVKTRSLRMRLIRRDKPPVWLCAFSHLCANVEPPLVPVALRVHGPLLYADAVRCRDGQAERYVQHVFLRPGPKSIPGQPWHYRIYPGCAHPVDWNFVLGWMGMPVVHVHYLNH